MAKTAPWLFSTAVTTFLFCGWIVGLAQPGLIRSEECVSGDNYCHRSDVCAYVFTFNVDGDGTCPDLNKTLVEFGDVIADVERLESKIVDVWAEMRALRKEKTSNHDLIYHQNEIVQNLQNTVYTMYDSFTEQISSLVQQLKDRDSEINHLQEQITIITGTSQTSQSDDLTILEFETTETIVTVSQPIPELSALTACIWVKITESGHDAAFVSYAIPGHDNEFLIYYYSIGFTFFIGNKMLAVPSPPLDDGAWHHVCITWSSHDGSLKYYHNGVLYQAGAAYHTGYTIASGGVMVLGQEQDIVGGRFDANQALVGSLTQFHMWSRVLDGDEIKSIIGDCSITGNMLAWNISNLHIEGDVSLKTKDVCETPIVNRAIVELKTITTNIVVSKPIPELVAVTACIWVKINETGHDAALVSYAVSGHDNEFLIHYLGAGFHVYVGNVLLVVTTKQINDGAWHHVCITWSSKDGIWKFYHNGVVKSAGRDYQTHYHIERGGVLVLGQEQDALGGRYDPNQALVGSLTEFNMWERVLTDGEIADVVRDCSVSGNLFAWNIDHLVIEGDVSQRSEDVCSSRISDQTVLKLKTTNTNVMVSQVFPEFTAISACIWVKINEAGHNAALVSYAIFGHDNEFLIHYLGVSVHVYIGNKLLFIAELPIDDGSWHHVCITWSSHDGSWKYYHNGVVNKAGTAHHIGYTIANGGVMVLGQEQDAVGGRYDTNQALVGSLTKFNMWSRMLSGAEIQRVVGDCSTFGDVFAWNIANLQIEGDVSLETEDVCESQFANRVILELKTVNTNIVVSKPIPELVAVTACIWVKIEEAGHDAALVSYAVSGHDNEFLIHYLGVGFHVYVGNVLLVITAAPINDGAWHHVCITWSSNDGSWKYYHNGAVSSVGRDYQTHYGIESSGVLVLGQEQDSLGGRFDQNQALVGSLTEFNMWERALVDGEITDIVGDCSHFGDLFAWNIDHLVIEGDVSKRSEDVCLSHISDRTVLELKTDSTNVIVSKMIPELSAVSGCIWVNINEDGHNAALVSYAVPEHDNEFLIHYFGIGFHVYIGNVLLVIPASPIDDRSWHHVCITWSSSDGSWKYYLDGVVNKAGSGHQTGYAMRSGGFLVLGQEQDTVGGRYQTSQALVGSLTEFNMWSTAMNDNEIATVTGYCSIGGDVSIGISVIFT
ncbi:uncharacterized protein [Ptychodera flava]|uniref:uncharacterized protein n=1 Tax=Ptychodera flava TaxID=63121 RepID=UPI00396A6B95